MTLVFLGWVVAPIITIAGGTILFTATSRVQDAHRQFEQLSNNIRQTADLGTQYWLSGKDEDEIPVIEAKIIGQQLLISEAFAALGKRKSQNAKNKWVALPSPFFTQLSGGDFMTASRNPDPARARRLQFEMARLVSEVRESQAQTLKFRNILLIAFCYRKFLT